MKIILWNVNGINACVTKGAINNLEKEEADIYCFQEMKCTKEKLPNILGRYQAFHTHAKKKGYSGVSTFSKLSPLAVIEGIGNKEIDEEGRILTLEFKDFFLVNAYFPHSSRDLKRLNFKLNFNDSFLQFCKNLEKTKPVIMASDFNVAHKEIDLAHPKSNMNNAGFTEKERNWFDSLIKEGFIDTFREFIKDSGHYTWWSHMHNARENNIGWRIDYFVISNILKNKLKDSGILKNIMGSDHCPIYLEMK